MTQSKQVLGNDTSILAQYRAVTNLQFVFFLKKVIKQSIIKYIYFMIYNTKFVLLDLISKYTIH